MDPRMPDKYLLLCGEHGLWQMCTEKSNVLPEVPAVRQVVGQAHHTEDPVSISTIAIHPKDTDIRYLMSYRQHHAGYVRRTTDGGKTWENISQPIKFTIAVATGRVMTHAYIIDPDEPNYMYFCTPSWDMHTDKLQNPGFEHFGVYRSTDAGYNWEIVNDGLPAEANVTHLCFDPDNPKTIYAAVMKSMDMKTNGGLYVTDDRGDSWRALPIPEEIECVNDVRTDQQNGKIYIACGMSDGAPEKGGVWVSRDKGQTWRKIFDMPFIYQVAISPLDSKRLAVSVGENTEINYLNPGAYLSFDGGKTWKKSNQGLGQPYWLCELKWDLTDSDIIWSGLIGSGWYKGNIDR
jgi:photosystem II stability/assembly factor-like uncharacterized protein